MTRLASHLVQLWCSLFLFTDSLRFWILTDKDSIVHLLLLPLGLTLAIHATIGMFIDAQASANKPPRYTKPASAAKGRSEEEQ